MGEESWRRNPGGGILGEESWRRNPGGGILEEEPRRILREESWGRNPGGGTLGEESWGRNPGGGILEEEYWRRNQGGSRGHFGRLWGALGSLWGHQGRSKEPKADFEVNVVKTYVFYHRKVDRPTVSPARDESDLHETL